MVPYVTHPLGSGCFTEELMQIMQGLGLLLVKVGPNDELRRVIELLGSMELLDQ